MKNLMRLIASLISAAYMVCGGSALAQTSLLPGGFASNSGSALENHDATWDILSLTGWIPFSDGGVFGTVGSWVSDSDALNPDGLTFLYLFYNDPLSTHSLNRFSIEGYRGIDTDVAYSTNLPGIPMAGANRDLVNDGDVVGLIGTDSTTSIRPGEWGQLIVYTNATTYFPNNAFLQNGGQAMVQLFAPIPEPETYAMLLAGLGLMVFIARRRRQYAAV